MTRPEEDSHGTDCTMNDACNVYDIQSTHEAHKKKDNTAVIQLKYWSNSSTELKMIAVLPTCLPP